MEKFQETDTAGSRACTSGKSLEEIVTTIVRDAGFYELSDKEKDLFVRQDGVIDIDQPRWFARQVRIELNLYGASSATDLYLQDQGEFKEGLHIECKWQASSGSVDEKYALTVNSLKGFKRKSILILDGGGTRPVVIRWIKSMQDRNKKFRFFTLSEFLIWAHTNLYQN